MIEIKRTNSRDPQFLALNKLLDRELAIRDGKDHAFYTQYNAVEDIKYIVIAFIGEDAVGCGAIKFYEPGVMEIKRMYVPENHRRKGIAGRVLAELEKWALELGFSKCILETGRMQPEAIHLYQKHGYQEIPNYGQYEGVENSICFGKTL